MGGGGRLPETFRAWFHLYILRKENEISDCSEARGRENGFSPFSFDTFRKTEKSISLGKKARFQDQGICRPNESGGF